MFKRKKATDDSTQPDSDEWDGVTDGTAHADEDASSDEEPAPPEPVAVDRSAGPFDIEEVVEPDPMVAERINFGAVQIPLVDGLEIRVEIDPEPNEPAAVALVQGAGAGQQRAFAGPKSGGGWEQALTELRREISSGGGTVDESAGPFGNEIAAALTAQDEQGNNVVQPIRFVGVDGPRWTLQGVMFGAGTDRETAGPLEDLFRSIVVVRGDAAMPVGVALSLTLPTEVPGQVEESDGDDGSQEPV